MPGSTPEYPPRLLDFYYQGFLRVLHRYLRMCVAGWVVVLIGAVGLPMGWRFGQPHGLLDIALSAVTILAGLLVVHQSVMALETYVTVPFTRHDEQEPLPPFVIDVETLMHDVREGGWWETRDAVAKLHEIAKKHAIPEGDGKTG